MYVIISKGQYNMNKLGISNEFDIETYKINVDITMDKNDTPYEEK